MSEKKPVPLLQTRLHRRCPVCGAVSYSPAGIHPQCSVRKADQERTNRIKQEKLAAKEVEQVQSVRGLATWQKRCPQCNSPQHVRKVVCGCGHEFSSSARPPAEGDGR